LAKAEEEEELSSLLLPPPLPSLPAPFPLELFELELGPLPSLEHSVESMIAAGVPVFRFFEKKGGE